MADNKISWATPDLLDDNPGKAQVVELQFQSFGQHSAFSGPCHTIHCIEDNTLVGKTLRGPGNGRVLVVNGEGSMRRALLGDMLAEAAIANNWQGVVVNGCIRDVDPINSMAIGVKALGTNPMKTDKLDGGESGIKIVIGNAVINDGDYIYADNNGVIVSHTKLD